MPRYLIIIVADQGLSFYFRDLFTKARLLLFTFVYLREA